MRIVLDTNVLISAMISRGSTYRLVSSLLAGKHTLVISLPIIEEFLKISSEKRIRKYVRNDEVAGFLRIVMSKCVLVEIESKFQLLKSPDDFILQSAYDGHAEIIVTGDKHLLDLHNFRRTRILGVSEAISVLGNN